MENVNMLLVSVIQFGVLIVNVILLLALCKRVMDYEEKVDRMSRSPFMCMTPEAPRHLQTLLNEWETFKKHTETDFLDLGDKTAISCGVAKYVDCQKLESNTKEVLDNMLKTHELFNKWMKLHEDKHAKKTKR